MEKSLEDALYDLNDQVQRIIEDYDWSFLGDEFADLLRGVDHYVTKMCIMHDVATMTI